jgi:AraC-like DNA-binding protein
MPVQNIPESFIPAVKNLPDLFVHDYRMTAEVVKSKVNLSLHVFSFLQTGQKKIHFSDTYAEVNEAQSILIKNGNCLVTELLNRDLVYYCKLFFFSQKMAEDFLRKHGYLVVLKNAIPDEVPFFVIENDDYIKSFVKSLSNIGGMKPVLLAQLLAVKFEEIMLYLVHKYDDRFLQYAFSLIADEKFAGFRKTVENYACSNLKLEEIAFLCNMSLSTFKRYFIQEYKVAPGKWLQQKRLLKARDLLRNGKQRPSEIYADFGYNSLSNFSTAFKNEFGDSPGQLINKE